MKVSRVAVLSILLGLPLGAFCQAPKTANTKLEHGKYLVTRVGKCQDCHTPHNERGEEIKEKWLQGSPLPFQPIVQMPWVGTAPPIAGLDGWTDAQALKFLTTGIKKDGKPATPPMPEYRFNDFDAAAVLAYLRSLKQPDTKEAINSGKPAKK